MFDSISFIDIGVVIVVLFFSFFGFYKGFANQLASFVTLLLLGLVFYFFYPSIFHYCTDTFRSVNQTLLIWILVILLTVAAFFFFIFTNKLLVKVLKFQISDKADHVYGVLLGLLRGVILVLFALSLVVILGPKGTREKVEKKSRVGQFVCQRIVHHVQPYLTPSFFEKGVEDLKKKVKRKELDLVE